LGEWWGKEKQLAYWREDFADIMAKQQPEGKIKRTCKLEHADPNDLIFWNIEGKSLNGVPDTVCGKVSGGIIFIEFKVPGKEPTQQQWKRIYELREAGQDAWWADSVETYRQLVGLDPRTFKFKYPDDIESWL
jgi:hypothetical protein